MKASELKATIDGLNLYPEYSDQINNILVNSDDDLHKEDIKKVIEILQNNKSARDLSASLINSAVKKIKEDISEINNLNQDN